MAISSLKDELEERLNKKIPDILYSGNHQIIKKYRRKESLRNTLKYRPDLLEKITLTKEDESLLEEIKQYNDNGTVFGSISKSDFENIDIVIPDINTIQHFQEQVKPIDDKIINNNNEIQTLIQQRDGLLSKLMSGEVKI